MRIETRGQQFHILQGTSDRRIGFVRPGERFELVSRDALFHSVQMRGASFFTCTLPDPNRVRSHHADGPGIVELLSGSGYFWMRGYLLATPHPYAAHTDEQGRFRLERVPAGEYEIVVWRPNWRVAATERNPDNARVQQVRFAPPLQSGKRVRVATGQTTNIELELGGER